MSKIKEMKLKWGAKCSQCGKHLKAGETAVGYFDPKRGWVFYCPSHNLWQGGNPQPPTRDEILQALYRVSEKMEELLHELKQFMGLCIATLAESGVAENADTEPQSEEDEVENYIII